MITVKVSEKGQITLPAPARRKLGIGASSLLEMEVRGEEIVFRAVRPLTESRGVFSRYAGEMPEDWDTVRKETEECIAREVAGE